MMRTMRVLIAAMLALVPVAALAQQAPPCAPYQQAADALTERHEERPIARGVSDDHLIEIWATDDLTAWAAIRVVPTRDGLLACLAGNGYGGWHDVSDEERPKGQDH